MYVFILLFSAYWRQDSSVFSRMLNPDWSIQISGAPAVCEGPQRKETRSLGDPDAD